MRTVRSSRTSAQTSLNYAYRLLARRDYSEARLVEKLHSKGFSSQATTATVETLRERGHVNDTRLAVGLTEWFQNQGFGPRAIWVKLEQKGLTEGAIEEALSGHGEETDVGVAQRLVERRTVRAPVTLRFAFADTSAAMRTVEQFDAEIRDQAYTADGTTLALAVRQSQADALAAQFVEATAGRGEVERP